MDRKEVIKWLMIMKANLNSFPEVSNAKKIEALAEAIRLLKNEQSEIPTGSTAKNDLGIDNQNIRLIDADALIKRLRPKHFDWWGEGEQDDFSKGNNSMLEEVIEAIEEFTPVTQIKPKGHWIEHPHEWGDNWQYSQYECSCCHNWAHFDTDYCSNCGVEISEVEE